MTHSLSPRSVSLGLGLVLALLLASAVQAAQRPIGKPIPQSGSAPSVPAFPKTTGSSSSTTDKDGDGWCPNLQYNYDKDGNGTCESYQSPDDAPDQVADCNDNDPSIHPGATEKCNGIDDDCDYVVDDVPDNDGDGYTACEGDCNDSNAAIHPGATEVCDGKDNDCDGSSDEGVRKTYYKDADTDKYGGDAWTTACSAPSGFVTNSDDCDDTNANIHPGAKEICDGKDNDCDGSIDEGVKHSYYRDADKDSYGGFYKPVSACTAPSGYVTSSNDCDDTDPTVYPGATEIPGDGIDQDCDGVDPDDPPKPPEVCDGVDNNGDGEVDEDGVCPAETCDGKDNDKDGETDEGFDQDSDGVKTCDGDCNDSNAAINPDATEICDTLDNDCDGAIDEDGICDAGGEEDGGGDSGGDGLPSPIETCNGVDDDGDGVTDEGFETHPYYQDADSDGFGNKDVSTQACDAPDGYIADPSDCDDTNAAIYPGAIEQCDGIDNDCDDETDEGGVCDEEENPDNGDGDGVPSSQETCNGKDDDNDGVIDNGVKNTYYEDSDDDGFGNAEVSTQACEAPDGYIADANDCDDTNDAVYPGAPEQCDELDNDCDGRVDEDLMQEYYTDGDGDNYGSGEVFLDCLMPPGSAVEDGDCDDTKASVYPGAPEQCDGLDNDCDGAIDEDVMIQYYTDNDGDTYGAGDPISGCTLPKNHSDRDDDCDDNNATVYPGATEIPDDGIDQDCNGDDPITPPPPVGDPPAPEPTPDPSPEPSPEPAPVPEPVDDGDDVDDEEEPVEEDEPTPAEPIDEPDDGDEDAPVEEVETAPEEPPLADPPPGLDLPEGEAEVEETDCVKGDINCAETTTQTWGSLSGGCSLSGM